MTRDRVVMFTWDSSYRQRYWLIRDYLPRIASGYGASIEQKAEWLGASRIEAVPIPHDCVDGFFHAYWRRPEAYLSPEVRAVTSPFRRLSTAEVDAAMERLEADLRSGRWHERNADLLELDELDLGYRLLSSRNAS